MLCTRDKVFQHACTHMCAWVHVCGVVRESGQKKLATTSTC